MPNFLIIGAMRSGTTTMYALLKQHPEIYMSPIKEPRFFAMEGQKLPEEKLRSKAYAGTVTNIEAYKTLFNQASKEKAIGEASPLYLFSPDAAERIKHYIPQAKLIAILRQPAERAYSHFLHHRRRGMQPHSDFQMALDLDDINKRFCYKPLGFYYIQLRRYFDLFEQNQIQVHLYDDLMNNPLGLASDIFRFLGVEPTITPEVIPRSNESVIPKSKLLDRIVSYENPIKTVSRFFFPATIRNRVSTRLKAKNRDRAVLTSDMRMKLNPVYRDDIRKLESLIQRDLSRWLM